MMDQVWGVCCWQPVAAGWCHQFLSFSSKRPWYPTSRHYAPLLTGMDSSSPWLKTCWMIVCSLGFATGVSVMMIGRVFLLDLEFWDLQRDPTSGWVSACRRVLRPQAKQRPPDPVRLGPRWPLHVLLATAGSGYPFRVRPCGGWRLALRLSCVSNMGVVCPMQEREGR